MSGRWRAWADAHRLAAIVIGGSAGAVEKLALLLPALPPTTTVPVIVVVHLRANEPMTLPRLYADTCALPIRVPSDKQPCDGGVVWFAPPDFHLLVESDRTFALALDEPVHFSRPAIDVLFESASHAYRDGLVAILLGGASRDGASGAAHVRANGGLVIVEDPRTAQHPIMPSAAIAAADPQLVADGTTIAALLGEMGGSTTR
jgi:two-component system chemotaxis response regulator CheB